MYYFLIPLPEDNGEKNKGRGGGDTCCALKRDARVGVEWAVVSYGSVGCRAKRMAVLGRGVRGEFGGGHGTLFLSFGQLP